MVIDITQETPEKPPRTYRKEHQISSVGGKGDVLHGRCGSSDVSQFPFNKIVNIPVLQSKRPCGLPMMKRLLSMKLLWSLTP